MNSKRDDWKSLVESVQNDRSRLQEDCIKLKEQLDEANNRIALLEIELTNAHNNNNSNSNIIDNNNNTAIPNSPSHHPNASEPNRMTIPSTPTTQIRTLRTELERITYEREIEKKNLETQKRAKG